MSIDKSLKKPAGLVGSRNVLKRAERLEQLMEEGRWTDGQSVIGLPKVRVKRLIAGKKAKKKQEDEEDTAATAKKK